MIDSKNGIIGLAIGDAMGVPIEFYSREELMLEPIIEMKGYGSYDVPKGSWSDDTSMTLATMDAICSTGKIDATDIANNFLDWFRNAKYTPTDKVFDIGRATLQALAKFELNISKAEECGGTGELDNGNGSLMRISPLIYYSYANNLDNNKILELVRIVSSITHKHETSIMACYIYVLFGLELLKGNRLKRCL